MKTKDEIQLEISNKIIDSSFRGIVLSSVRSGKTRIILESIKKYTNKKKPVVLLAYPNIDIKNSWLKECELIDYYPEFIFSTFISLKKVKDVKADFYLFDEAHLLPEENILPIAAYISNNNSNVIFASGTYNDNTLSDLKIVTGLDLIVNYTTEDAIKDNIISDFKVFVHQYNLNSTNYIEFGKKTKWFSTDYKECKRLSKKVNLSEGKEQMFAALNRMRFINSNQSLKRKVQDWLYKNNNKRFILFVPDENTGLTYNLPMFNSKSKDNKILLDFQKQKINQLCLIKKASSGITFKNLDTIVITAINSNSEQLEQQIGRSLLNDTQASEIHIFVSSEQFQLKWLISALSNISKERVTFLNI